MAERGLPRRPGATSDAPNPEIESLREDLREAVAQAEEAENWHRLYVEADIRDLHEKLQVGELTATGFTSPRLLPETELAIPQQQWSFLRLNFERDEACGQGLTYYYVKISPP